MSARRGEASAAAAVPARDWVVVIPVKRAEIGKSRLRVPGVEHEELARAIALDTIEAAASCAEVAEVIVVTSDEITASALCALARVRLVRDREEGLSAAIDLGLSSASAHRPRAVLLGDLPALRSDELARALVFSSPHARAFVPDAEGTGSVLATAQAGVELRTRFGPGSAAAHRTAGFLEIGLPVLSGLRRDLDVVDHLRAARRAGLGRRTSALLYPQLAAVS